MSEQWKFAENWTERSQSLVDCRAVGKDSNERCHVSRSDYPLKWLTYVKNIYFVNKKRNNKQLFNPPKLDPDPLKSMEKLH